MTARLPMASWKPKTDTRSVFRLPFFLVAAAFAAAAPAALAADAPPLKPAREIRVPFKDLHILLKGGEERVLLSRQEYEELARRARKTEESRSPLPALLVSAAYDAHVEAGRARIEAVLKIEALAPGTHRVALDLGGVELRAATLDGRPAPLGLDERGQLTVFVEGVGLRELRLEALTPLETGAARQVLNFRLPVPTATTLRLAIPGDVEVRGGLAVVRREYDEKAVETRFELLPRAGDVTLAMTLNSRLKRKDRVVMARAVLVDEVTQAYERLHATFSMEALHRAVRDFRLAVPAGFEVTDVRSPELSRWAVADGVLTVTLREDVAGVSTFHLSALRPAPNLAAWTFPRVEPLDAAGQVAVVGLLLEERLRAEDVTSAGLLPIDHDTLTRAMPPTVLEAEAGEARVRPVAAYYAPGAGGTLAARFAKPPARVLARARTLLRLGESGFEARGEFAILPTEERAFAVEFGVPPGWEVRAVTLADGAALPFERFADGAAGRVLARLPQGIEPGREQTVRFEAAHVPDGWFGDWTAWSLEFPVFPVRDAARDLGAIAVDARDDLRVRARELTGLTPLDENEKARYGLAGEKTSLAYRYESPPYRAQLAVERLVPRLTAETHAFFTLKPDVLAVHYEVAFAVEQARTRRVAVLLPTNTPTALAVHGVKGTEVKEYAAEETPAGRRWTAILAAAQTEAVRLALDFQMPLRTNAAGRVALPPIRADGVAYQSGFVAVEGSADLDVEIVEHPRRVDVGELTDAEYHPGRRLLGAFGFVGDPAPVSVTVADRRGHPLPPALVARAELATVLAAEGVSQSAARFPLRSKAPFLELRLPAGSTLWSVLLDGKPAKPQQEGESVLIGLPAGNAETVLEAVYETPAPRLGLWRRAEIPAPRLALRGESGAWRDELPVADLAWRLYPPTGYEVADAAGGVVCAAIEPTPPAAVLLARRLYDWCGRIGISRGLAGCATATLGSAAKSARLMSARYELSGATASLEEQVRLAHGAVTPPTKPPPEDTTMRERLQSMVIPELDFRQANIHDVVAFLQQQASQQGVAVNFGLSPEVTKEGVPPPITFNARQISLDEALKIATQVANLKYRVTPSGVVLEPIRAPNGQITYDSLERKHLAALRGTRSLKIDLTKTGKPLEFRSLGVDPSLRLTVLDRKARQALAWAVGLAVFVAGMARTFAPASRRAGYVVGALVLGTLLPALPALLPLAPVCNAAFYAACALIPYYLLATAAARAARRVRAGARVVAGVSASAPAAGALVLAVLLGVGFAPRAALATDAPGDGRYVVEMAPQLPVNVPADALIVPYEGDEPGADRVLVPYSRFRELWNLAVAATNRTALPPPAAYALGGARYRATLAGDEFLALEGGLDVELFGDDYARIALPLEGAVIERALLDGAPARLQSGADGGDAQTTARQAKGGKNVAAPAASDGVWLVARGKGRHRLELAARVRLARDGGWRVANARLPAAPATALTLVAPEAGTDVALSDVRDRATLKTERAGEEIQTALGPNGGLRLRWRPKVSEGEVDRTLTVESAALLDVREDTYRLIWRLTLAFRRGEREWFAVETPADYQVAKVTGENVKGWEADGQKLNVSVLQRAKDRETFVVHLWRPAGAAGAPAADGEAIAFPAVTVPEAIRHTGRLTIRHSPSLDLRTLEQDAVQRVNLADEAELRDLAREAGESPLGIRPYQTYEFVAAPFALRVAARSLAPRLRANGQTILRLAERERSLESRLELTVDEHPVYRVRVALPENLEVDAVTAPGRIEWGVAGTGAVRTLTVAFAVGTRGAVPVLLRGRLGGAERRMELPLPRLTVLDAVEQTGDLVVQTDPAFDARAVDLRGIEPVLMERVLGWLQGGQTALARLALRHRAADYAGRLVLTPRQAQVSCHTVTNVRVTDRAIEETVLLDFRVLEAGIREVKFTLPDYLADARIGVPLLRQKTVEPLADARRVLVTLELQDEVMNQLRVLVESDRLLTAEKQTARLPETRTGRLDRQYVSLESAGRDEVTLEETRGLEPLNKQQKEWAVVEPLLRGGNTTVFMAAPGASDATLVFAARPRAEVATAGARIGLAQALVIVDDGGAYRARQTYHLDNRTEQFLEIALPAGAELWTARVADEYVKPVAAKDGQAGRVRIPLVKTAEGDLDYRVELKYGGRRAVGALARGAFPLVRTLNVNVELSQVELRLPRTRHWLRFDGTMRRIENEGDFEAGLLSYQAKMAQRLIKSIQYGGVFEKARAASNLKSLKQQMNTSQYEAKNKGYAPNKALDLELSNSVALMDDVDAELRKVDVVTEIGDGNRGNLNAVYASQDNANARNVVLGVGANWDESGVATAGGAVTSAAFNGAWLRANDLENPELIQKDAGKLVVDAKRLILNGKDKEDQQRAVQRFQMLEEKGLKKEVAPEGGPRQPQQDKVKGLDQTFGEQVTETRSRGRRGQAELARKYQKELEKQGEDQRGDVDGDELVNINEYRRNVPGPVAGKPAAVPKPPPPATTSASAPGEAARQVTGADVAGVTTVSGTESTVVRDGTVGRFRGLGVGGGGGAVDRGIRHAERVPDLGAAPRGSRLFDHGRPASDTASGLASLDVELPGDDGRRWTTYRFTTPRGKAEVRAWSLSQSVLEGLLRVAVAVGVLAVAYVVRRAFGGQRSGGAGRGRWGTALIVAGALGLLIGVLPLAAFVVLIYGIVLRIRRARAEPAAA